MTPKFWRAAGTGLAQQRSPVFLSYLRTAHESRLALRTAEQLRRPSGRGFRARGFTLIELMVVVVIIAILAAISVPSVVERLRERRAQEAAERVAILYRSARMRAMGRGSAVFVRYSDGRFTVDEAVQTNPSAPGCRLPSNSCTGGTFDNVTGLDIGSAQEYEGVSVQEGTGETALEVCYTPLGRAFVRGAASDPLAPLARVVTFVVERASGGPRRTITVLPNGIARITARPRT
jgi:prepilin-type N-terminal cleavage/methylation domain-containing protein